MAGREGRVPALFPSGDVVVPGWRLASALSGALRSAMGRLRRRSSVDEAWEAGADAVRSFRVGRRGLTLRCGSGSFIVTQAGDPLDHVLEAGDVWRTSARGRVAAWALRAGTLVLVAPRRTEDRGSGATSGRQRGAARSPPSSWPR
jgi:hypothetical protein